MQDLTQCFCRQCGKPTLHVCPIYPFDHTPHILLTVFCCLWWLPIYLLLYVSHRPRGEWRCSVCGNSPTDWTAEDYAQARESAQRAKEAAAERRKARKAFIIESAWSLNDTVKEFCQSYLAKTEAWSDGNPALKGLFYALTGLLVLTWLLLGGLLLAYLIHLVLG